MDNLHGAERSLNLPSPHWPMLSSYNIRLLSFFWIIPAGTQMYCNIFHLGNEERREEEPENRKKKLGGKGEEREEEIWVRRRKEGERKEGLLWFHIPALAFLHFSGFLYSKIPPYKLLKCLSSHSLLNCLQSELRSNHATKTTPSIMGICLI